MYLKKKSMNERLARSKMIIINILADQQILGALKEMGFDEAKLKSGLDLHSRVEKLYQDQKREYSDQYGATEELYLAWEEARLELRKFITAAKLALMDDPTLLNSLGLNRGPHFTLPAWITQARLFYSAALQNAQVLEKLKEFAVTEEKLKAGLELVTQVEHLNGKQKVDKSDAKHSTRQRDAAFAELDGFVYRLNKIARAIFADKPEYLDKLRTLEGPNLARRAKPDDGEEEEPQAKPSATGAIAD